MSELNKPLQAPQPLTTRRILAFVVDFSLILALLVLLQRGLLYGVDDAGRAARTLNVEWVMFVLLPLLFFLNWALGINAGKRLFRLAIVDAQSGKQAGWRQLLLRAAVFSLLVPLNIAFLLPYFLTRRHQSFHDLLAGTCVVDKQDILPADHSAAV